MVLKCDNCGTTKDLFPLYGNYDQVVYTWLCGKCERKWIDWGFLHAGPRGYAYLANGSLLRNKPYRGIY